MRTAISTALILFMIAGCGINRQIDQMKALENCKYTIRSADSIFLANTDISKLIQNNKFNLESAPNFAIALLQQKLPLKARINLQIQNPGKETAGINEFDYQVLLEGKNLTQGTIDQKISIAPNGGSVVVPIQINQDIYPLLADAKNRKAAVDFLSSNAEKKAKVTLKIKPKIGVGNSQIELPGYFSIDKEISNKTILSAIERSSAP